MALENPLWHYVLELYSRPGVEATCLALQARGYVVNSLLLACWAGSRGIALDKERWGLLAGDWRQTVVEPLRQVRYRVREYGRSDVELDGCYQLLKAAELACEQAELMQLYRQLSGWEPRQMFEQGRLMGDNLVAYCQYERLAPEDGMLDALLEAALAMPVGR